MFSHSIGAPSRSLTYCNNLGLTQSAHWIT
jgi:hypothetical protein